MFSGLSAFPLTPVIDERIDEEAVERLVQRLVEAGVDSIGALGSTGSYAYLNRAERAIVSRRTVGAAGDVPVIVGVGALRTRDVLEHAEDAQNAGAAGVLLAPMTYQALSDDEVHGLFEDVSAHLSVPLVVYDNPSTTHVTFTDALHARIARLPGVTSIKIPPVSSDPVEAAARVGRLRALLPEDVGLGISGDSVGAEGLLAGCDTWYSALAGILPGPCVAITRAAASGQADRARDLSGQLAPIWSLIARYGSLRVAAAFAQALGVVTHEGLPRPVRGLDAEGRRAVDDVLVGLPLLTT